MFDLIKDDDYLFVSSSLQLLICIYKFIEVEIKIKEKGPNE